MREQLAQLEARVFESQIDARHEKLLQPGNEGTVAMYAEVHRQCMTQE